MSGLHGFCLQRAATPAALLLYWEPSLQACFTGHHPVYRGKAPCSISCMAIGLKTAECKRWHPTVELTIHKRHQLPENAM